MDDSLRSALSDPRAVRVTEALSGTALGPVGWVDETGSTNEDLLAEAVRGAPAGLVLTADHQSAGRGRRDRTWESGPGDALMVSILLVPPDGIGGFARVTTAVGLAATEACRAIGATAVGLKWPNDLVIPQAGELRKLGGILAQSFVSGDRAVVVVGLGLNVRSGGLGSLGRAAVALDEVGGAPDREALLIDLLVRLDRLLGVGVAELRDRYRARCLTIGTRVRVSTDDEDVVGEAVDVTDAGALVVDTATGRREVVVGDVVSVRGVAET